MAAAGVVPERVDEGDFGFRLGPRINAAGRLYRADAGVELMLTADDARAEEIATELDRANQRAARGRARGGRGRREQPPRSSPTSSATPPGWCSRARDGTRASSGSSPRGWSSAITARRS